MNSRLLVGTAAAATIVLALFACGDKAPPPAPKAEAPNAPSVEPRVKEETGKLASTHGTPSMPTRAPRALEDVLKELKGKYALYAHRSAKISKVEDLAGKELFIAFVVNSPDEVKALGGNAELMATFVGDADKLINEFHMNPRPSLSNNAAMYLTQLLEKPDRVGLVLVSGANVVGVSKSPQLVRLSLKPPAEALPQSNSRTRK